MSRIALLNCDRCHKLYPHNSDIVELHLEFKLLVQYKKYMELCINCGRYISSVIQEATHSPTYYTSEATVIIDHEDNRHNLSRTLVTNQKLGGSEYGNQ
jgi:hypothetical protein